MSTKLVLQLLLCAFVFTSFAAHTVWCERDCYRGKELFKAKCMEAITIVGPYAPPSAPCIRQVKRSDMVCICSIITLEEERQISMAKAASKRLVRRPKLKIGL